jgi:hypothetical protein
MSVSEVMPTPTAMTTQLPLRNLVPFGGRRASVAQTRDPVAR